MATVSTEDFSSASSNSPGDDAGTPSDFCQNCKSELDPLQLIVNVKTLNVTVDCGCCGELNKAGKWTQAIPFPTIKLEKIPGNFFLSRESRSLSPTILPEGHPKKDAREEKSKGSFWDHSCNKNRAVLAIHEATVRMEEKPFSCLYCDKIYDRKSRLVTHMRSHTGEKPFECQDCGKKFSSKSVMIRHIRSHAGEKPFKCDDCGKKFNGSFHDHSCNNRAALAIHETTVPMVKKRFSCLYCDKIYNRKSSLITHIRSHTGEKPFKCEDCGKNFTAKSLMILHIRSHIGEKPFECMDCGKKFVREDHLNYHVRIHTGEKLFECKDCGKKFIAQSHLIRHTRSAHTGEKPFECEECGSKFNRKDNLNSHIRIHTGEKRFECEDCGIKFNRRDKLNYHIRSVHTIIAIDGQH